MNDTKHGVSAEPFDAFEVVTVSFAVPVGYGAQLVEVCNKHHTTAKTVIAKLVRSIVVTQTIKE